MENVSFGKRLIAYLIDIMFVFLVAGLISGIKGINPNYDKYVKAYDDYQGVLDSYTKGDLTEKEFLKKNQVNYYKVCKYGISNNIVILVAMAGYFVLFQKYNNGQTLGKKLTKIKVVNKDSEKPTLLQMLLRTLLNYYVYLGNIVALIINIVLLFVVGSKNYMIVNTIVTYVFVIVSAVSLGMMIFNKKGIHELVSKTKVINE